MNLELKELAATIAIGGYFQSGLHCISKFLLDVSLADRIFNQIGLHGGMRSFGLTTVCFAVGMLAEDVSNKFMDADTPLIGRMVSTARGQTDDAIKVESLIGEPDAGIAPLARHAACRALPRAYLGKIGEELETAILRDDRSALSTEALKEAMKQYYYSAKNRVYQVESYNHELEQIQQRIDFSRALFSISLLHALAMLICILLHALRDFARRKQERHWLFPFLKVLPRFGLPKWKPTVVGTGLLFIFVAAVFAFQREERQFDLRVYGYFVAIHADSVKPACSVAATSPETK